MKPASTIEKCVGVSNEKAYDRRKNRHHFTIEVNITFMDTTYMYSDIVLTLSPGTSFLSVYSA